MLFFMMRYIGASGNPTAITFTLYGETDGSTDANNQIAQFTTKNISTDIWEYHLAQMTGFITFNELRFVTNGIGGTGEAALWIDHIGIHRQ